MAEKNSQKMRRSYQCLEQVIGCKWSVSVLKAVERGVDRPGALERDIAGISTKILSERLRKLTEYGLLNKKAYAEVPPRVVYSLSSKGRILAGIIDKIHALDRESE